MTFLRTCLFSAALLSTPQLFGDDANSLPAPESNSDGVQLPYVEEEAFKAILTSDGLLAGRFRVLDSATGKPRAVPDVGMVLIQRGRILKRIDRTVDGVFQVEGVVPGVYSVIASCAEGYSSFGVEVIAPPDEGSAAADAVAGELSIDAYLVSKTDFPAVFEVFRRFAIASGMGAQTPSSSQPPPMFATSMVDAAESDAPPAYSAFKQPTLLLDGRGDGLGEVVSIDPISGLPRPVVGATVAVIRNGVVIQSPVTGANGFFEVSSLAEGVYSLAIATPVGSTAVAVVAARSRAFATADFVGEGTIPVTMLAPTGLTIPLAGADANGFQPGQGGDGGPGQGADPPPGAGAPGAGGGGTGGGAGGGAGGGGGLLGAALGAALGGAVAAGLDDNPAPVSPGTP